MANIRANGNNIEYEIFGKKDGIPFLLIHGFAQQLIAWEPEFISGLTEAGLRVVTFDNRDVGLAKKWDGEIPDFAAITAAMSNGRKPNVPYTLSDMAADAVGLLDALDIESAHICGASMGGQITQLIGMDQVVSAMENIRESSLQMASSTKQTEKAAHDLHNLGQRLQEIVKLYKV